MVKWNILANYVGQAWVAFLGLACIPIYIRLLGIEAYGIISFIISLQIILTILDLGITISLNREFARLNENSEKKSSLGHLLRTVEVVFASISVLLLLVFYLFRENGGNIFNTDLYSSKQSELFIVTAGILISFRLLEGMYKSCLVGMQKQIIVNVLNIITASIRHLGAIFLLMATTATIEIYLYWQITTSIIAITLFAFKLYGLLPKAAFEKRFTLIALQPMWRFSLGVMGMSILSLFLTNIDRLILVSLVSLEDYAEYMVAIILSAGLYSLIGPIVQAVFPRLCELREADSMELYKVTFHKAAQLICITTASISAIIFFNVYDILKLWTQDELLALNVSPLLKLIIIGTLLNCLTWMPFQCLLAFGNSSQIFKINLISVLFVLPTFFVLVKAFGVYGAAITWLVFNTLYFLVGAQLAIVMSIQTELKTWLFRDALIPGLCAFTCAFLISSIKWFVLVYWWQALIYYFYRLRLF
jgi:O-antigen/teichoic acid export membrane protein